MRWTFFDSLFRRGKPAEVATQPPGQVFALPKGTCLKAIDEAVLALPEALLCPDETIESVIRGDDEMLIQFDKERRRILLKMKPGMSVSFSKSCQAVVLADDQKPRRFEVTPAK